MKLYLDTWGETIGNHDQILRRYDRSHRSDHDLIHQCIYLGHEELSIKENFSCLKLVLLNLPINTIRYYYWS
ncbi:hypothetical protein RIR_jg11574.t1 [Rhizophagus irregularis DAOM 181602=DAOM 197198]|nr:hypothetical protein RIR_jg11574.t1 [Rhizophagus irregularis DAOM 181602=DAOM 197198]